MRREGERARYSPGHLSGRASERNNQGGLVMDEVMEEVEGVHILDVGWNSSGGLNMTSRCGGRTEGQNRVELVGNVM